MTFAAIADWAASDEFPVAFMCTELGVSRSGCYAWRGGAPSRRSLDDTTSTTLIKKICADGRGNPGVRRVRAALAACGHRLSHKRVWRLMKAAGLHGRHPKAWKRTTIGGDRPVPAPDLIGRDCTAAAPDTRWCGDVTSVKTWDGWASVATVIDLYSHAVVGWAVADHMRTSLVTDALDMAIAGHRRESSSTLTAAASTPPAPSTRTADRTTSDVPWAGPGFVTTASINAVSESFFATYKN
ncbi:IS3 family transposase [Protofrankia symbiont of Coriaria ruscifolia]|uniref:IS3 family transposase n=1 Tax=Protofrankia symbiont of Coriaria ruscifolia TaxID=1306542 RepID=UPI0013EF76A7|nr:IS3 family transposase [Protofrankia symbiont of Coriaria ruscifolia]